MIPDAQLGIAILTNQESGAAFESIVDHIIDAYLGAKTSDWIAAYQAIEKRAARRDCRRRADVDLVARRSLEAVPAARPYAGRYRDQLVRRHHRHRRQRRADDPRSTRRRCCRERSSTGSTTRSWRRWTDRELRADAFLTFALNPDGTIDSAKMQAVSPDTDFSFDFQDLLLRPMR